jgi:hypothetical protein
MESRFGHDFSGVRVHTDAGAARAADAVQARAYTVGQDIVFGDGQYAPGASQGAEVLSHELAHVVQQAAGPVAGTPLGDGLTVSDPADRFEQAADQAARSVHPGEAAEPASIAHNGGLAPRTQPPDPRRNRRSSDSRPPGRRT